MKLSIKKNMFTIILSVLLLAIFALIIAVVFISGDPSSAGNVPLDTDKDGNNPKDPTDPIDQNPPEEPPFVIPYTYEMPKAANASSNFLFEQTVCGLGNIALKNTHTAPDGTFYAVVSTDCTNGDVKGPRKGIGVVHYNSIGTLLDSYFIPATKEMVYIASNYALNNGLIVITADTEQTNFYINIIARDLKSSSAQIVSGGISAEVFPLIMSDGFLVFVTHATGNTVYGYSSAREKKLLYTGFSVLNIVRVIDYYSYLLVFANTVTGYSVFQIDPATLTVKSEKKPVESAQIVDAIAFTENKVFKYMIIEQVGNEAFARKISSDLNFNESIRESLGNVKIQSVHDAQKSIYLVVNGAVKCVIDLEYDLSCSLLNTDSSFFITNILDSNYFGGKVYILASDVENNLVLLVYESGALTANYLDISTARATLLFGNAGQILVTYDTNFYDYSAVGIVAKN